MPLSLKLIMTPTKMLNTPPPSTSVALYYFQTHVLNEEMNDTLQSPISLQEVKNAVYDMGALKAPGLDGFRGCFIKNFGNKST